MDPSWNAFRWRHFKVDAIVIRSKIDNLCSPKASSEVLISHCSIYVAMKKKLYSVFTHGALTLRSFSILSDLSFRYCFCPSSQTSNLSRLNQKDLWCSKCQSVLIMDNPPQGPPGRIPVTCVRR